MMAPFPLFTLLVVFCVVHLPKEKEVQNILTPSQIKATGIEGKFKRCGTEGCHTLADVTADGKKS